MPSRQNAGRCLAPINSLYLCSCNSWLDRSTGADHGSRGFQLTPSLALTLVHCCALSRCFGHRYTSEGPESGLFPGCCTACVWAGVLRVCAAEIARRQDRSTRWPWCASHCMSRPLAYVEPYGRALLERFQCDAGWEGDVSADLSRCGSVAELIASAEQPHAELHACASLSRLRCGATAEACSRFARARVPRTGQRNRARRRC